MFFVEFLTVFCLSTTGETVETTTDQRNLSIIGRDKIYISSKKREVYFFFFFYLSFFDAHIIVQQYREEHTNLINIKGF